MCTDGKLNQTKIKRVFLHSTTLFPFLGQVYYENGILIIQVVGSNNLHFWRILQNLNSQYGFLGSLSDKCS